MVKKILVTSCDNCPYSDFKIDKILTEDKKKFKSITLYRCDELYETVKDNKWRYTDEIPLDCPLEDEV